MKTIAITIDESTLSRLDELSRRGGRYGRNRSRVIRKAVEEYLLRLEHQQEEERERVILHKHRLKLRQQATALVKQQAQL